jgi:hypothetical protein
MQKVPTTLWIFHPTHSTGSVIPFNLSFGYHRSVWRQVFRFAPRIGEILTSLARISFDQVDEISEPACMFD